MNWSRRSVLAASLPTTLGHSAVAQTPKRGGTLRSIINPEPPGTDLRAQPASAHASGADKIYQGLLHYSFDLMPLPELAKSWTISPDGVVYTFNLEPRHRFWHSWTT
jgi:peptide/nickel transport system substrate-binding protein